jgi:hypothetical protein
MIEEEEQSSSEEEGNDFEQGPKEGTEQPNGDLVGKEEKAKAKTKKVKKVSFFLESLSNIAQGSIVC